ncbi:MAG: hypothetical protein ACLT8C_03575 [Akkermansia muciniphila]
MQKGSHDGCVGLPSGSSLSRDIASMRSQLEKYSQAEALVKRAYEDVNVAAAFLKARDYGKVSGAGNESGS